jgi:hypothetical protein
MFRIGYDTFCLEVNFINDTWQRHHVAIGLFEAPNIEIVKSLLAQYQVTKKIVAYVKDEGSNLNTLASVLLQVFNCDHCN